MASDILPVSLTRLHMTDDETGPGAGVVFDPKPDITPWELAKVFACYTGGNFEPVYRESVLSRHFRTDDGMSLDYHIRHTGEIQPV